LEPPEFLPPLEEPPELEPPALLPPLEEPPEFEPPLEEPPELEPPLEEPPESSLRWRCLSPELARPPEARCFHLGSGLPPEECAPPEFEPPAGLAGVIGGR